MSTLIDVKRYAENRERLLRYWLRRASQTASFPLHRETIRRAERAKIRLQRQLEEMGCADG